LLKDARENYPAWLDAIGAAKRHIHFESYIIHEDNTGREFADALIAKAREGVRVRLIYDWMGGFGKTSRGFWNRLLADGVEVRCYNPPRLDSPIGWLSRDHRKMTSGGGSAGRAAAGAIRIGNAVGAAVTNRRVLEPVESRIMLTVGAALLTLAILFAKFPRALAYPVIVVFVWIAVARLYKGYKLRRPKDRREE
jgi:hypothetical protein